MRIHAIQTGSVRIKLSQVSGRGHGLRRRVAVFGDSRWTDWLPTYAWMIDHPEGVIVVDTGQARHLLDSVASLHPYQRWQVAFRIEPHEEIGPQLRTLGVGPRDVQRVVVTHLHMDHDGGLAHFPHSAVHVARGELERARGWMGLARGYLPHRWPSWFDPVPLDLGAEAFGPFATSLRLTRAGDVVAIGTPGHTPDHLSVVVVDGPTTYLLAGDASYNEDLMLAGTIDGVSINEKVAENTLAAIQRFARDCPVVYLPTHDPECAVRLAKRAVTRTITARD